MSNINAINGGFDRTKHQKNSRLNPKQMKKFLLDFEPLVDPEEFQEVEHQIEELPGDCLVVFICRLIQNIGFERIAQSHCN